MLFLDAYHRRLFFNFIFFHLPYLLTSNQHMVKFNMIFKFLLVLSLEHLLISMAEPPEWQIFNAHSKNPSFRLGTQIPDYLLDTSQKLPRPLMTCKSKAASSYLP